MIKAIFLFLLTALAVCTGCYFVMRTKEQRKSDFRSARERFTDRWNKSVAYFKGLMDTKKSDEELQQKTQTQAA